MWGVLHSLLGPHNSITTSVTGDKLVSRRCATYRTCWHFIVTVNCQKQGHVITQVPAYEALVKVFIRHLPCRGAHTFFLKQGQVARWGGYNVNLIHYEDAAGLCVAVSTSSLA